MQRAAGHVPSAEMFEGKAKRLLKTNEFRNFKEFYPFYLGEHSNLINRRLHIIGTTIALCWFIYFIFSPSLLKFLFLPVPGYGLAWIGHFFFEKHLSLNNLYF
jgi:hypothetical protein